MRESIDGLSPGVLEPLKVICFIRDGVLAELREAGALTEGPHILIGSWGLAEQLHASGFSRLLGPVLAHWRPWQCRVKQSSATRPEVSTRRLL